jgi:glycosyltransferase involved in cell wall biosynthesis
VVPNGVDLSEYESLPDRRAFRGELGIGAFEPLVVNVGRISWTKALHILVLAVANLHRAGIPAHLALVGPDDEGLGTEYGTLAAAKGISDYFHVVGPRGGLEKLAAFAAADAWALPAQTESFGIVVLEALAAGAPVVVSAEVNLSSQIVDAQAGLVAAPTEDAMTSALRRVLTDHALRRDLALRGRLLARRFDWSDVAVEMAGVYRAVLEGAGEGGLVAHRTNQIEARSATASLGARPR